MQHSIIHRETKHLLLLFILDNIEIRKRSAYLQDIIGLSKINTVWQRVLNNFLSRPLKPVAAQRFCLN